MRLWLKIIIGLAIVPVLVCLGLLGWIIFGYIKYGSVIEQACADKVWWEDKAQCAANVALAKNDPRYCRINHFGETGDLCALLYAEQTTDPTTCQNIDLIEAEQKCVKRFQDESVEEPEEETETTDATTTEEAQITDNSDARSCDTDKAIYCPDERTKLGLVSCLLDDHYTEISDACRNSLERRQRLNEELVAACQIDRAKFCQGVEPKAGSEPMVDCLGDHYDQLSAKCAAAWDAHDSAKLN